VIPERPRTTLGKLTLSDLLRSPAWEGTRTYEGSDEIIEALSLNTDGSVPRLVGEVWCKSRCVLANGTSLPACALYRGDKPDGPDLWTVWLDGQWVSCKVPPAPERVLERRGPAIFASTLGVTLDEAFPLVVSADLTFETAPPVRQVRVTPLGVERP